MNTIRIQSIPRLISAALAFTLTALPVASRADTVLNESFAAPLSPEIWRAYPKDAATSSEGMLTLTAQAPADKYAVSCVQTASPSELLNFMKRQVEIKFTDLDLAGDATPASKVFIVALTSDSGDQSKASSEMRLRFDGLGSVMLTVTDKGESKAALAWRDSVVYPVKRVKLTLNAAGAELAVEDAGGAKSWKIPFTASMEKWANVAPTLRIQAQRSPGEGVAKVTIQGLKVESVASSAK